MNGGGLRSFDQQKVLVGKRKSIVPVRRVRGVGVVIMGTLEAEMTYWMEKPEEAEGSVGKDEGEKPGNNGCGKLRRISVMCRYGRCSPGQGSRLVELVTRKKGR